MFAAPGPAQNAQLGRLLTAPIRIERATPVTTLPLEARGDILFVQASANGEAAEFIFDTGSPTVLSRQFADALGLEAVAQNTGRDANGTEITMDFAILETLSLGTAVFHDVPVLIHDFSDLDMGACLVSAGILGSELFPGSAWRIDTEAGQLSFAASLDEMAAFDPVATTHLYDFGYPHAPIVDYSVGDVSDKALFDTGNSAWVALFTEVAETVSVQQEILRESIVTGTGFEGESAGGRGEAGALTWFTLQNFRLDHDTLGPVRATTRAVPPTLVGAGVLSGYVVTMDYPGEQFLLEARSEPAPAREEPGYALALVGDAVEVAQLFDGSAAADAGLRLGDQVIALSGRSMVVSAGNSKCSIARSLIESFDASQGADLTIMRDGIASTISIPQH
ncbi:aspartyl protease family protein [Maricaulis sp.]|uniref:aspartyl protease family protein n=1 Tax=Maricaulis sp. TaxID=1486257 RepID=UPI003A8FD3C2